MRPGVDPTTRSVTRAPVMARGLTLIELIVVLIILSVISTIALRTTDGVVARSRLEATDRTLNEVARACLSVDRSSGVESVSGFVADIGRLPVAADGSVDLDQLWSELAFEEDLGGAFAFQPRTALAPDADIALPSGWRGPYVQLDIGETRLVDGWGNQILAVAADDLAIDGIAFAEPVSLVAPGSNGPDIGNFTNGRVVEDLVYDPDRFFVLDPFVDLAISVFIEDENGDRVPAGDADVTVKVFFPSPVEQPRAGDVGGGANLVTRTSGGSTGGVFTIDDVPSGFRIIRVTRTSPPPDQPTQITRGAFIAPGITPTFEIVFPFVDTSSNP